MNLYALKHLKGGCIDSFEGGGICKLEYDGYISTEYHEPLELSGNGEVREGKPHIHAVFGREDKSAVSSHLHYAKVENWFVNVYIAPLEER